MKPLEHTSHSPLIVFLFNFIFFFPAEHPTASLLPSFPDAPTLACFLPPFHFWLHNCLHNLLVYSPEWIFCVKEQQIKTEKPFESLWSMLKACLSYEDHAWDMWQWSGPRHKTWQLCPREPVSSLAQDAAFSENALLLTNSHFLHSSLQLPLPCCCLYSCLTDPLSLSLCPVFCYSPSALACTGHLGYTCHQEPPGSPTFQSGNHFRLSPWVLWLFLSAAYHCVTLAGGVMPCKVRGQLERGITVSVLDMKGSSTLVFVVLVLGLLHAWASCTKQFGPAWLPSSNHTSHLRWPGWNHKLLLSTAMLIIRLSYHSLLIKFSINFSSTPPDIDIK